ncbi:RNA methyltransferase [Pseudothauera lacus]|uniref:tRNA (cytidine/uridine-2'-O-)-methyltransferase TrmJ n=1 Tax=Pseudothauera lacus TaxID=2136175 RepID=A0A2T4IJU1_9RHOO|nr:RNA methyltransferase [Pseudothauera lacus]PTD98037.1 tRNA (cytosine(32)/uridine(32)-2'-O)-methyltransferase TrmJ [Pseudothauera lacus]
MNGAAALDRIRIVLSRTSHPGNIGAAARAMKTMGLSKLWLVAPQEHPSREAWARASGAIDILDAAQVVPRLEDALAGTVLAAALTARRRELSLPRMHAREAATELLRHCAAGEVALVFGNETSGLTNEEVALCGMPVSIPANPEYSSLNLGAAVQLLCYELRMAALAPQPPADPLPAPATHDEVEGFFAHLERVSTQSGFHDPANPKRLLPRLRRLFGRARLEREEVSILRGLLTSVERKVD